MKDKKKKKKKKKKKGSWTNTHMFMFSNPPMTDARKLGGGNLKEKGKGKTEMLPPQRHFSLQEQCHHHYLTNYII